MSYLSAAKSIEHSSIAVQRPFGSEAAGHTESGAAPLWNFADAQKHTADSTFVEFIESDGANAAATAARELTRAIPAEAKHRMYVEHGALVEKQFLEGLTNKESVRLRYLRWQIDRFQDADAGEGLDRLETLVALHEKISREVSHFANHATQASLGKGRSPRGTRR